LALLKGRFYKVYWPMRGRRFEAGRNFRVFGSLEVRGPGRVIIGDDTRVIKKTTAFTHSPDAVISVGNRVDLVAVRFGCQTRITIGDRSMVSECRIMDTDFHSIAANRREAAATVRTAAITIGENVWIAPETALLPGTSVGDNSVIAFGAICSGAVPANVVMVGNPARVAGKVPTGEGDAT
jgi:carbonic anhydrase/acetyltransferase-like protein (isoleucine patch superfamily)